jgi:DNA end-binding protein Ku
VPSDDLDIPAPQRKPSKLEVSAAQALVEQLSSSFRPDEYEDTYREALLELIERKARGETIAAPEPETILPEDDLLEALRASLAGKGKAAASRTRPKTKKAKAKAGQPKSPKKAVPGTSRSSSSGSSRTAKPARSGR